MAIQTEVTLQPDYTFCLHVMGGGGGGGGNSALQKFLLDHLVSVPVFDDFKY